MVRPALILWIGLPAIMTIALLLISYEVKQLEHELAQIESQRRVQQEEIHVLNAEWSYLNNPKRLAVRADKYLSLKPISPEQIVVISDLPLIKSAFNE